MISPQLTSELPPERQPGAAGARCNDDIPKLGRLRPTLRRTMRRMIVKGGALKNRMMGDAVVAGLWHCLLGSLAAGLAVSAVLGVLVLALSNAG